LRAGRLIDSALGLAGVGWLGALVRLLPERDPHESLFEALTLIADRLDDADLAPALVARFEAQVLADCGFALDLESCAATGTRDELIYVSPKSGRAISAAAGEPWRERLLPLPGFLRRADGPSPNPDDVEAAFRLTGFFLTRDLFAPRGLPLPDSRRAFLAAAAKAKTAL
jgi:DNA repair protein RecO (recombination protein O)